MTKAFNVTPLKTSCIMSEDVVVIGQTPNGSLPLSFNDVMVLHAIHANGAQCMSFDNESGVFTCPHCGTKIPVSNYERPRFFQALAEGKPVKRAMAHGMIHVAYIENVPEGVPAATPIE